MNAPVADRVLRCRQFAFVRHLYCLFRPHNLYSVSGYCYDSHVIGLRPLQSYKVCTGEELDSCSRLLWLLRFILPLSFVFMGKTVSRLCKWKAVLEALQLWCLFEDTEQEKLCTHLLYVVLKTYLLSLDHHTKQVSSAVIRLNCIWEIVGSNLCRIRGFHQIFSRELPGYIAWK